MHRQIPLHRIGHYSGRFRLRRFADYRRSCQGHKFSSPAAMWPTGVLDLDLGLGNAGNSLPIDVIIASGSLLFSGAGGTCGRVYVCVLTDDEGFGVALLARLHFLLLVLFFFSPFFSLLRTTSRGKGNSCED